MKARLHVPIHWILNMTQLATANSNMTHVQIQWIDNWLDWLDAIRIDFNHEILCFIWKIKSTLVIW